LGDFVEEATELVRPWERPDHKWPVYGVNNVGGVFFSHHQRGETFNSPYKRIYKDWFFHNPTRANVGSLGRVPNVPNDAITSPEYQVWRIRDGLTPEFVSILIRCPFFVDLIDCHRVGAVKQRLFVENLREIPIPVCSDIEQSTVVSAWNRAQRALDSTLAEIAALNRYSHFRDTPICSFFGRIAGFGQCAPHEYEWRFRGETRSAVREATEHYQRALAAVTQGNDATVVAGGSMGRRV